MRQRVWWTISIAGAAAAIGCSDGTSPASSGNQRVNLMVAIAPGQKAAATTASDTIQQPAHTLVLDEVDVVLDRVRLKRVEGSCPDTDDSAAASNDQGGQGGDADDDESRDGPENDRCEKFVAGPLLVQLPLTPGTQQLISVDVDTGTYRRANFFVHKVGSSDGQFATDHPDLVGKSILVKGTFDGTPFTYTTNIVAMQRTTLDPPLVVTTAGATDLTLLVDVSTWFVTVSGDLIDPATAGAGGSNEHRVRFNIKRSFRVFKDKDHDGHEDHADH